MCPVVVRNPMQRNVMLSLSKHVLSYKPPFGTAQGDSLVGQNPLWFCRRWQEDRPPALRIAVKNVETAALSEWSVSIY